RRSVRPPRDDRRRRRRPRARRGARSRPPRPPPRRAAWRRRGRSRATRRSPRRPCRPATALPGSRRSSRPAPEVGRLQEPGLEVRALAHLAYERACDDARLIVLLGGERQTELLGLDDAARAARAKMPAERVGDLVRRPLLQREP